MPTLPDENPDRLPAYVLWVELTTRITSQRLHYRSGNEEAAIESIVGLFKKVRELLEKHPTAEKFRPFSVTLLNTILRPHTARWDGWLTEDAERKSQDGSPLRHFRDEQVRRLFRKELQELRVRLIEARKELAKMGGFLDLAESIDEVPARLGLALSTGITNQVEIKTAGEKGEQLALPAQINIAERQAILRRRIVLDQLHAQDSPRTFEQLRELADGAEKSATAATLAAHEAQLTVKDAAGLALSGGGIRSATFCLGVVQVLAERNLLRQFDYLSTVSGGGYLGSFLSCALGTTPAPGPTGAETAESIQERFNDVFSRQVSRTESGLLRHLRNNSKYLLNGGVKARVEIVGLLIAGILWNFMLLLPLPVVGALLVWQLDHWGLWGTAFQAPPPPPADGAAGVPWPSWSSGIGVGLKASLWALTGLVLMLPLIQRLTHGLKPATAGPLLRRGWEKATLVMGAVNVLLGLIYLLPAGFHGYEAMRSWLTTADGNALKSLPDWGAVTGMAGGSVGLGLLGAWLKPHWPRLRGLTIKLFILSGPLFFLWVFFLLGNRLGLARSVVAERWPVDVVAWGAFGLVIWGWICVNINTLAPHRYYRSKLCECYLTRRRNAPVSPAKSRWRRLFTGETSQGRTESLHQIKLSEMGTSLAAPYHLINTILNLPGSDTKELRGREGDFFVISKYFCGAPTVGYVPTKQVEAVDPHFDLGTAMAVSGAAASTSMGWKSMPHFRFLMTLFNVRLGYWLCRPGTKPWWRYLGGPGPQYLFREMAASMTERSRYLNLSDGGHIENLATYELLRRKCKFIVCVDAGQEPGMECADLIRLQRYALIDLGIEMEFSRRDVELQTNKLSRAYAVLIKLDYTPKSPEASKELGWMIYLKLALTGVEPAYVTDYRRENAAFPHESTGDQFYDEAQFEAYRMLGQCAAESLFREEIIEARPTSTVRDWFQSLANKLLPDNDAAFKVPVTGAIAQSSPAASQPNS